MGDRRWASLSLSVVFPRRPNPTSVSPPLRPRKEETTAAAFESARVQPFNCSQQTMLGFRFASAPLRFHDPLAGFPKP